MADTTRDGRSIEVTDDAHESAYAARVDGVVVGRAFYQDRDGRVVFTHTEVDPSMQGQGIATVLARVALDDVSDRGREVVPECPFIAAFIRRHPEHAGSRREGHGG